MSNCGRIAIRLGIHYGIGPSTVLPQWGMITADAWWYPRCLVLQVTLCSVGSWCSDGRRTIFSSSPSLLLTEQKLATHLRLVCGPKALIVSLSCFGSGWWHKVLAWLSPN